MNGSNIPDIKTDKERQEIRIERIDNIFSNILIFISTIVIIIGVIVVFIQFSNAFSVDIDNRVNLLDVILSIAAFGGAGLSGFILAEIIQILHDIRYCLFKMKK